MSTSATRIRAGAIALAAAGLLFLAYPALRPWHDEGTVAGATASMSSTAWVTAHFFAMLGFILMPLGLLALRAALAATRAEPLALTAAVLAWIGSGLVLPYYGAEDFGLHAIAGSAGPRAGLLSLVHAVRYQPLAMTIFGAGLLLLAAAAIMAAIAVWRSHVLPRTSAILFATGMALFLPQFFGPAAVRIAHGILLAAGSIILAAALWASAPAPRRRHPAHRLFFHRCQRHGPAPSGAALMTTMRLRSPPCFAGRQRRRTRRPLLCRVEDSIMKIAPGIHRIGGNSMINAYLVEQAGEVTIIDAGRVRLLQGHRPGAGRDGPHARRRPGAGPHPRALRPHRLRGAAAPRTGGSRCRSTKPTPPWPAARCRTRRRASARSSSGPSLGFLWFSAAARRAAHPQAAAGRDVRRRGNLGRPGQPAGHLDARPHPRQRRAARRIARRPVRRRRVRHLRGDHGGARPAGRAVHRGRRPGGRIAGPPGGDLR